MAHGGRARVARRPLLVAALTAAALPTAACGIRLEDHAPRVPFVPTRTPVPLEAELVRLTQDTKALADAAAALPGELAADLARVHRRQHAVLRTTLLQAQVPAADLDAPASPGATASASPSPSTSGSAAAHERAALATAEGTAAASAGAFAGVAADLRATVAALHAQRYAAAELLSGTAPDVPTDPVGGAEAARLASLTSAAIYLVEVVAARSTGKQRARAVTTLGALRDLHADQLAGGAQPEADLGHPLPFPVESAADAARLARSVLTSLRAGSGEQLAPLVAAHGAAGLAAATRWVGVVEVEAHRWGVGLAPFPGLT